LKNSPSSKIIRIAVTMDYDDQMGYFLKRGLYESLKEHSAEIVPLVYDTDQIRRTLSEVDGVILPGGLLDIDPALYNEKAKFDTVKALRRRCDFEYRLLDQALPKQIPMLNICWGLQLLNVYLGGTLYQDLPSQRPTTIKHEQDDPYGPATHKVLFVENGEAQKMLNIRELSVNSTHHQALDQLGKGLQLEGTAEDGLVECVSLEGQPFNFSVQWHPERLKEDPIIPAFLKACRRLIS